MAAAHVHTRIRQLMPTSGSWFVILVTLDETGAERLRREPVAAWALVEDDRVVGVVRDQETTDLVLASGACLESNRRTAFMGYARDEEVADVPVLADWDDEARSWAALLQPSVDLPSVNQE